VPPLVSPDVPPLVLPEVPPLVFPDVPPLALPDVPPLVPPEVPPLVSPDVPPLVLPEVPPLVPPDVPPLVWPEVPPLAPDEPLLLVLPDELVPEDPELELASAVLPDELVGNPSAEPLPFPELDGPEGPDGPVGPVAGPVPGPAASGPISRVEQSTSPHISERAADVHIVAATPPRMAMVTVEQPIRVAFFIFAPCQRYVRPRRAMVRGWRILGLGAGRR
jgi:hypothetical protein